MNTFQGNPVDEPMTPEQALQLAAQQGVSLSSAELAEMAALMEARRRQVATASDDGQQRGFVARFNRFYPAFLQALIAFGDVMIAGVRTVLIAFGVPVVLLVLLVVEQTRVKHGIVLFEHDAALSEFGAWAVVILNLLLEVLIHWKEQQAGYAEPERHLFSLRIAWQRLAYALGIGSAWQPRPLSPAARFRGLARIVTFTILALALGGSMRDALAQHGGAWLEAIGAILFESSLKDMATWAGGLLFAAATVLGAQHLSRYAAARVVEIVAVMQTGANAQAEAAASQVGAAYVVARMKEAQRARRRGVFDVSKSVQNGVGHDAEQDNGSLSKVRLDTDGHPQPQGKAVAQALQWLKSTPEGERPVSVRDMAEVAGVSKSTMYNALKLHSSNGAAQP